MRAAARAGVRVLAGPLKWFERELRFHPRVAGGHPLAAYVLGLAFGFGWTPCIGPVLGAILTLSATQTSLSQGITLLSFYAAGLGVPFLLAALFMRGLVVAMMTGQLSAFSFWLLKAVPALGRIG